MDSCIGHWDFSSFKHQPERAVIRNDFTLHLWHKCSRGHLVWWGPSKAAGYGVFVCKSLKTKNKMWFCVWAVILFKTSNYLPHRPRGRQGMLAWTCFFNWITWVICHVLLGTCFNINTYWWSASLLVLTHWKLDCCNEVHKVADFRDGVYTRIQTHQDFLIKLKANVFSFFS